MILNSPYISGSLTVTGNIITSGSITISGSIASSSYATTASNALTLQGVGSASFAPASTFNTVSQSYASASGSLSTRVTNEEATSSVLTSASSSFAAQSASLSTRLTTDETNITTLTNASASFAVASGSMSSRVTLIEGQYATTGSNNFTGIQHITSTVNPLTFNTSASLYTDGGLLVTKDSFVSGTAYFNNVVVYGTSSIQYITSSQINIGASYINLNTNLPAQRYGGMAVADSGSNPGVTGSMLWDSVNNGWIYSRESGSSYRGGALISGPRASVQGSEQTTTACYLMAGQGGDHITSSAIYTDSNATCFYGTAAYISSSGAACFGNAIAINAPASGQALTINNRNSDNTYGSITFYKCDGTTFQSQILNSNIGTNGGQLSFYTKPDGGSSTLAMTICSNQTAVFASCVTTGQLTNTVSSGNSIILNKGTGPYIQFNKTNATAQSWGLSGEGTKFYLYNENCASTPFIVTTDGTIGLNTTSPCTVFDVRTSVVFGSCGAAANSFPLATFAINATDNGCRGLQIGSTAGGVAGAPVFLKVFGTSAPFAILNQSNCAGLTIDANNIATFACQVCSPLIAANSIQVNGGATCPTNACISYGMFGYSGVGLGIAAGATGAGQGMAFFTCGNYERLRIMTDGSACFACTVCATNIATGPNSNLSKSTIRLRSANDGNYLDIVSNNTCNTISSNYGTADTPIIIGTYTGYQVNQLFLSTTCKVGIYTNAPVGRFHVNSTYVQTYGPTYGKAYITTTASGFTNPTVTVFQFAGSYPYAQTMIKVRVWQNSVSGGYSSLHYGFANYVQDSNGNYVSKSVTTMCIEGYIGSGNVGTLSWAGTCLQYTTNRMTNYDAYQIEVEYGSNNNVVTTPNVYPDGY